MMQRNRVGERNSPALLSTFVAVISALWLAACSHAPAHDAGSTPKEHALSKLRQAGVSSELVAIAETTHDPSKRDRIVALNVLGFLFKADYSGHFNSRAVRKCAELLAKHRKKFERIEALYGVSKEIIVSLLWVETKHGTHMGRFNVLDVYFSLLQADHPEVTSATLAALEAKLPTASAEDKEKALERAKAKADWALAEIQALDKIHGLRLKNVATLSGSYAGAFGIPQFIPSSYLAWAKPRYGARNPNLFKMDDAIHSVANYLKANGWKRTDNLSKRAALLHYNNSEGYADVIQKLAAAVKKRSSRHFVGHAPAAAKSH